jgi:hypothetical protein
MVEGENLQGNKTVIQEGNGEIAACNVRLGQLQLLLPMCFHHPKCQRPLRGWPHKRIKINLFQPTKVISRGNLSLENGDGIYRRKKDAKCLLKEFLVLAP